MSAAVDILLSSSSAANIEVINALTAWKIAVPQLVKKFAVFCGNRMFIDNSSPTVHILSHIDPVHVSQSHFLKLNFNNILPPTPRSPKWSLSLRFPHQNPVCTSPSFPIVLHAPPFSFFSILSSAQCLVTSTDHSAPHYVIFSTLPLPRPT